MTTETELTSEIILSDEGVVITLRPGCSFTPEAYRVVRVGQSSSGWIELFGEDNTFKVVIPNDMFHEIMSELEAGVELTLIEFDDTSASPSRELILECEN
jgi:hypothetical protein